MVVDFSESLCCKVEIPINQHPFRMKMVLMFSICGREMTKFCEQASSITSTASFGRLSSREFDFLAEKSGLSAGSCTNCYVNTMVVALAAPSQPSAPPRSTDCLEWQLLILSMPFRSVAVFPVDGYAEARLG